MKLSKPIIYVAIFISVIIIFSISYYFAYMKAHQGNREPFQDVWSNIPIFYYINLKHRDDRKRQILGEMAKVNIPPSKIKRIDAVYNKQNGHIGCSMSHIQTLEHFIESGYEYCLIFEDDFEFTEKPNIVLSLMKQLFDNKIDFDVCMLSASIIGKDGKEPTKYEFLEKVNNAQTTSGYIVSKKFAPTLLGNYKEGCAKLIETNIGDDYAVDQYWKLLQPSSNWYIFKPKLGLQAEGYSDIQKGVIFSGV